MKTRRQSGLTLIELMLGMTLSMFVLLSLTGLLLAGKASYKLQDQYAQIQETGRYAIDVIARAVRQAGYENWNEWHAPVLIREAGEPSVVGVDARTSRRNTPALDAVTTGVVNGSDILALRFFAPNPDRHGAMLNCAGFSVTTSVDDAVTDNGRSWSIFFVARDATGEPELRCKYRTQTGWNADAIARGIDSFQVLYGIDADGSGSIQFMNADAINALGVASAASSDASSGVEGDLSHWKKVKAIRVALLISGPQKSDAVEIKTQHDLFGMAYSERFAGVDKGVRIAENALPTASRNRTRAIFTQTIQLRNDSAGAGT